MSERNTFRSNAVASTVFHRARPATNSPYFSFPQKPGHYRAGTVQILVKSGIYYYMNLNTETRAQWNG